MIISGYAQRSIATQTGDFGYNISMSLSNTMGQCLVSFSGLNNNLLSLNFLSGKIYDSNNRYVYSYESNDTVNLQGFINSTNHNLYANSVPIEFTGIRNTGYINYMVVNSLGCSANFDFSFSGFLPPFSIPYVSFNNTGLTGTGYIVNNDITNTYLFRFFTGSSSGQANYSLISLPTGNITGSGTFLVQRNYTLLPVAQLNNFTDYQSFSFETNFGDYQQVIPINYTFPVIQNLSYNIPATINSGIINNGYIYWNNLLGVSSYTGLLNGQLTVNWLSGNSSSNFSGDFTVQTGNLDGTQMTVLPYYTGITGYQSNIFSTSGNSGVMIEVIQNTLFANGNIIEVNYSGYNTGITNYLQTSVTSFPVQYVSAVFATGLNGSGSIASNYLYWITAWGQTQLYPTSFYEITVSGVSGVCTGNFSGAFLVQTGHLNGGGLHTLNYQPTQERYIQNYLTSVGMSGILLNIIQNSGFAGGNVVSITFTGNSTPKTQVSALITGAT